MLDDFVRRELGLPSREQEVAAELLRQVDVLHHDLYQQQVAAYRDAVEVRLDRQRAERYRADAERLPPGSSTDAITASEFLGWAEGCEANAGRLEARLPERRAKVAELLEQIAAREAEPAVIAARALLQRQPPAPWTPLTLRLTWEAEQNQQRAERRRALRRHLVRVALLLLYGAACAALGLTWRTG